MTYYRFMIFARVAGTWRFTDALATEEAADEKAYRISLATRVKMIDRYETAEGKPKIHRMFYFYRGKYSHTIKREI